MAEQLPPDIASKVAKITSAPPNIHFAEPNMVGHNIQIVDPIDASTAYYAQQIEEFDAEFMEQYTKEHWVQPLHTAMHVAVEEVTPLEAYKLPRSTTTPKPLYIPYIDKDVPQNYKQAMSHPHQNMWKAAMDRELQALRQADTWDLVDLPVGRKAFPNR